jgi:hypothetical protein
MKKYIEKFRTQGSIGHKKKVVQTLSLVTTVIIGIAYLSLRIFLTPKSSEAQDTPRFIESATTMFQESVDQFRDFEEESIDLEDSAIKSLLRDNGINTDTGTERQAIEMNFEIRSSEEDLINGDFESQEFNYDESNAYSKKDSSSDSETQLQ